MITVFDPNPLNIDTLAQKRHLQLTRYIRHKILNSKEQRISFAKFMKWALTTPKLGYYRAHPTIFGAQGDFVTAPEISSVFNHSIAHYCEPILKTLSKEEAVILEIGAGTGRLAADLLLTLKRLNALPKRYDIVEVSDTLKQQQQQNFKQWIPELADLIQYHSSLPKNPMKGVIIANEVLDTFPVHCFQFDKYGLHERYVTWNNDGFTWVTGPPSTQKLHVLLNGLKNTHLKEITEYRSEVRLNVGNWLKALQAQLTQGCLLLFDYGGSANSCYHPQRTEGTLRCYYQHQQYHDPFARVGLQDITSDVDFSQVAKLAGQAGFKVEAYTSQAAFLLRLNLLELSKKWYDPWEHLKKKGQIHQLISPFEMGERIQFMVLSQNFEGPLVSLKDYDRRAHIL